MQDLQSWLSRLERLHPTEIELGLERVSAVARALDIVVPAPRVISVAGTNGKGSCVRTMEALLLAGGHSVGAYSSPHLLRFNERVRINGTEVADGQLVQAFEAIDAARGEISLTYFEFTTLAALWLFKLAGVEFALLEVGLGGRLDAVNLVDAEIAVITSIAVDHEAWLGSDREVIGREKAGILRSGKLFVCSDPQPPMSVVEVAQSLGCSSYYIGKTFTLNDQEYAFQPSERLHAEPFAIELPALNLPRPSMAAAITVLALAGALPDTFALQQTLAGLKMAGRCQTLGWRGRNLVLDVGHNPAAANYLAGWLSANPVAGKTYGLVAAMADKDLPGLFAPLAELIDFWQPAELPGNDRAADCALLEQGLDAAGVLPGDIGSAYLPVTEALEQIVLRLGEQDRLLVFGSFFTVAEVLQFIQESGDGESEQ